MLTLEGEDKQIFVAAVLRFDVYKSVVWIAEVDVTVNEFILVRPPEAILFEEMLVIVLDKGLTIGH